MLPEASLPTFQSLGAIPQEPIEADVVAHEWLDALALHVEQGDFSVLVTSLLLADSWWRDVFALTWDLRTFHGPEGIVTFLSSCVSRTGFDAIALTKAVYERVFPDIAWVLVHFSFAMNVATGRGVVRLVYTPDGWRALTVSTHLDGLKGHPERLGAAHRDLSLEQGHWERKRREALEFAEDPDVLVIGAGQSGLEVAARLQHLGVRSLVVEKNACIGDNWRGRYDRMTLQDPIWVVNMPYLPFPKSWPAFPSASKFANWLEFYADALELNVWTSSEAVKAVRDEETQKWTVTVRQGGAERTFLVAHVVLAQGFSFKKTVFPGQESFAGRIMYSTEFKSAEQVTGRVVVVGACSSAHDIASDCADRGLDVTMVQRSATYVISLAKGMLSQFPAAAWEHADVDDIELTNHSLPPPLQWPVGARVAAHIRELDRDLLDGLKRVGYSVANGLPEDSGLYRLVVERGGGYYLDAGSCQRIIEGKIKVRSGMAVEQITEQGIILEDGSMLAADTIIVATGFDDARVPIRRLLGEDLGAKIPPVWGVNAEGELRGPWRELEGAPNMWLMMGNLSWCRYFSKFVALQIKAKLEGVYGTRYAAPIEW